MRVTALFAFLFSLAVVPGALAQGPQRVLVQSILVLASNTPGATDKRVAPYEPNLKRVLRFESYRSAGDAATELDVGENKRAILGPGHQLDIEVLSADAREARVRLKWSDGKREYINTTLRLPRGTPAVLGGPPRGDSGEVYAIIVIAL